MRSLLALLIASALSCGGNAAPPDILPDAGPGPDPMIDASTFCTADLQCDDGVDCTVDTCDVESGDCVYTPNDLICDNGFRCDGQETCNLTDGCLPGIPPELPPGAECIDPGLTTGSFHTCALTGSGGVRCWGFGANGQLGYSSTANLGDNETPADMGNVFLESGTVIDIAAGSLHTCALFLSGQVQCWGKAEDGQLGYGNLVTVGDDEHPGEYADPASGLDTAFVDVGGKAVQITAGAAHTCVLLEGGKVRCWGRGGDGQLGYGFAGSMPGNSLLFNIGDNEYPSSAGDVPVGGRVVQLAAGGAHTCALLDKGNVRCWGRGNNGALGYGNRNNVGDDETPAEVGDVDVGGRVIQLAAGGSHTCALLDTGNVRCWGYHGNGQLGYATSAQVYIGDDEAPAIAGDVDVGGRVVQLAAGGVHTCAVLDTGAVRCWGSSEYGQLGYGNELSVGVLDAPSAAGDVDVGGPVVEVAAGGRHTCAILADGNVRCWGDAGVGQLGYGNIFKIGNDETPASAGNVPLE